MTGGAFQISHGPPWSGGLRWSSRSTAVADFDVPRDQGDDGMLENCDIVAMGGFSSRRATGAADENLGASAFSPTCAGDMARRPLGWMN